jgi:hypothetical protein
MCSQRDRQYVNIRLKKQGQLSRRLYFTTHFLVNLLILTLSFVGFTLALNFVLVLRLIASLRLPAILRSCCTVRRDNNNGAWYFSIRRVAIATNTNFALAISLAGLGAFRSLYSPRKQCSLSPLPVRLSTDPKSTRVRGAFRQVSSVNSRLAALRVVSARFTEPLGMLQVRPL